MAGVGPQQEPRSAACTNMFAACPGALCVPSSVIWTHGGYEPYGVQWHFVCTTNDGWRVAHVPL